MAAFSANIVSAQQLQRLSEAVPGTFGFLSAQGAVTTSSGLTIAVAAIAARSYIINGALQTNAYAGGTVTHDAADGSNPRLDTVVIDTSGAVSIVKGTPAADPAPADINATTQLEVAQVLVGTGVTEITSGDITQRQQLIATPEFLFKAATQVFTTDTTYADVTAATGTFSFPIAANEVVMVEYHINLAFGGTGGLKLQMTGPAAPTAITTDVLAPGWVGQTGDSSGNAQVDVAAITHFRARATAFSSAIIGVANKTAAATAGTSGTNELDGTAAYVHVYAFIQNGANAGTVTLQAAQQGSNSTTTLGIGSWMRVERAAA